MSGKGLLKKSWSRALLVVIVTAGIVGFLAIKSHQPAPAAQLKKPDPQQVAFEEARQIILRSLPKPSTATFTDCTDNQTGAAVIAHGVWEAWGRIDYESASGAVLHSDWQVAWDRISHRIIYWRLGRDEHGNYAEALGASKAYSGTEGE